MSEDVKLWTSKRKSSLVIQILKGQTSTSEASRLHGSTPSELKSWVDKNDVDENGKIALMLEQRAIKLRLLTYY